MDLRQNAKFRERHLNVYSNFGGLGDHLARLPAIKYVKEEHPHVRLTVYWHEYFVELAKRLLPESQNLRHLTIKDFLVADESVPVLDFSSQHGAPSLSLNLVEHAFLHLTMRLPPTDKHYEYLKYVPQLPRTINEEYVILTPCFTAEAREWRATDVNQVMHGLHERGYKVVLLGTVDPIEVGNGAQIKARVSDGLRRDYAEHDLINKTSLIECLELMSHAKAIMGVDNGLMHLSECVSTPQVWGFTSVEQELRLPRGPGKRASVTPTGCYGCQSKCYNVVHDFRKCMFGDYLCVSEMTADKFLEKFDEISGGSNE